MSLLAIAYSLIVCAFIIFGGVILLYLEAKKKQEVIVIESVLPRIDLLNRIGWLHARFTRNQTEAYRLAIDECCKYIGRVMADYPNADWDTWWGLTHQVFEIYFYEDRSIR